jgi:hypothetical protein
MKQGTHNANHPLKKPATKKNRNRNTNNKHKNNKTKPRYTRKQQQNNAEKTEKKARTEAGGVS